MSQEAIDCKTRRKEAEQRREAKALKKVKEPIVPVRTSTSTSLDPNSAAAKRLAAKRGGGGGGGGGGVCNNNTVGTSATISSTLAVAPFSPQPSDNTFEVDFDNAPSFDMNANDQSFEAHFDNNLSFFEEATASTTPFPSFPSSQPINKSTLSTPNRSCNTSVNNVSLLDEDFLNQISSGSSNNNISSELSGLF